MGLEVLSDFSEIIPYPIPDFPLYAGIGKLEEVNQYSVCSHWHPDFEFSYVLEGSMDYFINGEEVQLREGDGIFVNSKRLHYNYSRENTVCKYLVLTVSPRLLPEKLAAVSKELSGITDIRSSDYLILKRETNQDVAALSADILKEVELGNKNPVYTLSLVYRLLGTVLPQVEINGHSEFFDKEIVALHSMRNYVHANFQERITLEDIAKAGNVCKSKCCRLFKKYIGKSPIEYVLVYRLNKSKELLTDTGCSVCEAAMKCGFSGQSYYTQMFRKYFGVTPRSFRAN